MKKLGIALALIIALIVGVYVALQSGGGSRARLAAAMANYERTLDAYSQTDTTVTDISNTLHADGRPAALISAFFGLDNGLPAPQSSRVVCSGANRMDGMPVIFSHEVDVRTLEPGDFKITRESGAIGEITCLTLAPADDAGELRTVLLAGEYGSEADEPQRVEIVGNILSLDGTLNFKGTSVPVTPLLDGPSIVWADIVPKDSWSLESEGTFLPFGGGTGCPAGTKQILRVTWSGGITKPGGAPADDAERQLYQVAVRDDADSKVDVTPFALGDLNDGDNNHKLCLDTEAEIISVSFPAGHLTDPREDLNPDTKLVLADLTKN